MRPPGLLRSRCEASRIAAVSLATTQTNRLARDGSLTRLTRGTVSPVRFSETIVVRFRSALLSLVLRQTDLLRLAMLSPLGMTTA